MEFGLVSGNRVRGARRTVSLSGAALSQQAGLEAALRQRATDREHQAERREQEERNRKERAERLARYAEQEKLREEERQRLAVERGAALERARVTELERRRLEEERRLQLEIQEIEAATRKREKRQRERTERRHDLSGDCTVCMEPLTEDAAVLDCPHALCPGCWTGWRRTCDRKRRQRTCPVCRAEVDPQTDESEPPSPEWSSDELEPDELELEAVEAAEGQGLWAGFLLDGL
jgi:hypothetical protein